MTVSVSGRNAQWTRAALVLLQRNTIAEAADDVGVSARSLQRWLTLPDFQAILQTTCDDAMGLAARRLAGMSASAVGVLDAIMSDDLLPPGVRSRSADLVLANALKYQEAVSLAQRVRRLEQGSKGVQDAATLDD